MSLFGALFSGVSGLSAQSQAVGIIGDNITNVNTTAFKRTTSEFSALVTGQRTPTAFSPGGVLTAIRQLVDTQGLLQSSNSPFDLGIDGAGFFVVSSITNPTGASGKFFYTRDGTFVPDKNGDLRNAGGFFLRGYEVTNKLTGAITSDRASLLSTKTVNVKNLSDAVAVSTAVTLQANLQSTQTVNASIGTYVAGGATTNMAPSAAGVVNFTPDFARSVSVVDSQGGTRTLTFAFLKESPAVNTWNVEVYVEPSTDITSAGGGLVEGQVASGTISFNADGSFNSVTNVAGSLTSVSIPFGGTTGTGITSPQVVTVNYGTASGFNGFTQFASESRLISSTVDGSAAGSVDSVTIDDLGVVRANLTNGVQQQVFKLPLATFANPNGLQQKNGSVFAVGENSGTFTLQLAGETGAGVIAPSTLEASTVDLAEEFTDLIIAQRAFSSAGKIITTTDEMLDELVRLKR